MLWSVTCSMKFFIFTPRDIPPAKWLEWQWWYEFHWWRISWCSELQCGEWWDPFWWDSFRSILARQRRMDYILTWCRRSYPTDQLSYNHMDWCYSGLSCEWICLESECWMDRTCSDGYRIWFWCLLQSQYRQSRVMVMESGTRMDTYVDEYIRIYPPDC
jgi:hypothetical protein